MRHIQKKISIEPLVSRLPSILPAFMDDGILFFDEYSIQGRGGLYPSNYGMIPINLVLNKNPKDVTPSESAYTEFSFSAGCHCYADASYTDSGDVYTYDDFCEFTLSFYNLSKWVYFFKEYYNLLKRYGHCGRVYTSAQDYYNYESNNKFINQMKYGSDLETYIELDNEFAEKGGVVWVQIFDRITSTYSWVDPETAHDENSGDTTAIVDVEDRGFYKWICDNIVPSFKIPRKYADYWNANELCYPDVLEWIPWLEERAALYENFFHEGKDGEVDTWDCLESENCCDCEEYFKRGGRRILEEMIAWNENIQETIEVINSLVYDPDSNEQLNCFIPTVIMPMELQCSIDDLGEQSILSKDYELGIDYRTASNYETANTQTGTVVTISGDSMILTSGSGYNFINDFMEKEYDENAFSSYTDRYISSNPEEFTVNYNFYTFDENNKIYTSNATTIESAETEFSKVLQKRYHIESNEYGWVVDMNDMLYAIESSEYGIYDESNKFIGGRTFIVYREKNTDTPYVIINGEKIYADFYERSMEYYFPFFLKESINKETCGIKTFNIKNYKTFPRRSENTDDKVKYINYNGSYYLISDDTQYITINVYDCPIVNGYAVIGDSFRLYCFSGGVYVNERYNGMAEVDNANIENDEIVIDYTLSFTVYTANEVTGRTVSKLIGLKKLNTLTDDIGNEIDGIYDIEYIRKKLSDENKILNHQPQEGKELELLYQVGNTCNIQRFSKTTDNLENEINYFVGDIITQMRFYYKTYSNEIMAETIVDLPSSGVTSGYTSLDAILSSTESKINIETESGDTYANAFLPDIYCDVTYYIGATLSRKYREGYVLAESMNHGIEYHETVRFVKEKREYFLKVPKYTEYTSTRDLEVPIEHGISYPIYVYKLVQDFETITDSQYGDYEVPLSKFRAEIDTFEINNSSNVIENFSGDMATHNNMQVFPTFMEEYKMGIATLENVDSDIYIDRGINASYEKHLKLGEVTSLEALEQYGNGYFKIMEN